MAILLVLSLCTLRLLESRSLSPSTPSVPEFFDFSRPLLDRVDDIYWIWRGRRGPEGGESTTLETSRAIGLAMYAYADDNGGKYPTGRSSTEVFQKLIDGEYISDPGIFYAAELHIPGKCKATSNKLKPENVCWDVTIHPDTTSTDGSLPLLFSTGFKMNYVPGGSAVPQPAPSSATRDGIAVYFVNNSAMFKINDSKPDQIVPNVISFTFKANEKTYIQLSPDGPVP